MKRRIAYLSEQLADALRDHKTVTVTPKYDEDTIDGYVVGLSAAFILLHIQDTSVACLNGYTALPLRDISKVHQSRESDSCIPRALHLKGIGPVAPQNVDLTDFPSLLSSIDAHFPLTSIHLHEKYPDSCFIGRVARLGAKAVSLRKIDLDAQWIETEKFRYDDITRIDFGGGYKEALWLVAQDARKQKEQATHD